MSDKVRVVMRLEGKTLADLRDEYYKVEDLMTDILCDMKNWNKECDCPAGESSLFAYVDEEIVRVCLNCGGDLLHEH